MRRPYLAHLGVKAGVRCMLVDGAFIRNHLDVDFTNGAHDLTRRYIPRGEVWVDREAPGAGEVPILLRCYLEHRAHMVAVRAAKGLQRDRFGVEIEHPHDRVA